MFVIRSDLRNVPLLEQCSTPYKKDGAISQDFRIEFYFVNRHSFLVCWHLFVSFFLSYDNGLTSFALFRFFFLVSYCFCRLVPSLDVWVFGLANFGSVELDWSIFDAVRLSMNWSARWLGLAYEDNRSDDILFMSSLFVVNCVICPRKRRSKHDTDSWRIKTHLHVCQNRTSSEKGFVIDLHCQIPTQPTE